EPIGRGNRDAQGLCGAEVEVADAARHERVGDARQVEPQAEQVEQALDHPGGPRKQLRRLAAVPAQAGESAPREEALVRPDQLGRAVQLVDRRADVHPVELERSSYELAYQIRETAPGDALDDLADEVAVREPVVACPGAGFVGGRRTFDGTDHV